MKGDVCLCPNLGLSLKDIRLLSKLSSDYEIELWHAAGNISFDEASSDETFLVNLDGTKMWLNFVRRLGSRGLITLAQHILPETDKNLITIIKLLMKKRTGSVKDCETHMKNQN